VLFPKPAIVYGRLYGVACAVCHDEGDVAYTAAYANEAMVSHCRRGYALAQERLNGGADATDEESHQAECRAWHIPTIDFETAHTYGVRRHMFIYAHAAVAVPTPAVRAVQVAAARHAYGVSSRRVMAARGRQVSAVAGA